MQGFETFGWQHLLWLLALAAAGAAALFRAPARDRGIAAAAAVLAVSGRVVPGLAGILEGSYGLSSLPLHVCSMAGYGCFLHFLMTARQQEGTRLSAAGVLSELLYFPGLPGALMALLFPGWGDLPAFSFLSCCEFLGHFGIVLYVLLALRSGTLAPRDFRIPLAFCGLYAAVMYPFDRCTGMNYGFLLLPAPDSPLSAIAGAAGGGAGYYAGYALLVLVLLTGSYKVISVL